MALALTLGAFVGGASAALVVPDAGVVVHNESLDVTKREIDAAHAVGVRWISIASSWESLEPEPDSYLVPGGAGTAGWELLEAQLAYAKSRGMKVELRLTGAPQWASGRRGVNDPPRPENLSAYGDFLVDLARRLGPYVDAYSPWNEPNVVIFWFPVDPVLFAKVQQTAYRAIKPIDPGATILSGPIYALKSHPGSVDGYQFLAEAYRAGLAGSVDAIGWNMYPFGTPEGAPRDAQGRPSANTLAGQLYLRDLIDRFDPGRRVWIMETGWNTCVGCTVFRSNAVSESGQADYLKRAFTYRRRHLTGITARIFWFNLRDHRANPREWKDNQGLLRSDFSAKPAYEAMRSLAVEVPDDAAPAPRAGRRARPAGRGRLPRAVLRSRLPRAAGSPRAFVRIGRTRLVSRRGYLILDAKVAVRGGASRVRVDGYRSKRWRAVTVIRVERSSAVRVRFLDRSYVGVRVRATVPGRTGWRAGRVIPVPTAGSAR